MKKKNCFLFVFIFSLFVANLFASQNDKENNDLKKGMFKAPQALGPEDIIFVNTGEMNIAGSQLGSNGGGGVIYIPQSVQMLDEAGASQTNVKVVLNGDLYVGGNFYQDTKGTVFELGTDKTVTDNEGTVHFIDYVGPGINGTGINGSKHEITTTALSKDPDSLAGYDRYREYIAFPHVRIETNDSIVLDARMGMDALHVKKGIPDSKGTLVLESGVYKSSTGNECVYDASLRIFGEGNSESLVDESAVIVKKDVSKYRVPTGAQKPQLFPFATPFKKQLAGYFAGNWVRVPTIDVSDNYHTKYVLGNKPQDEDDPNNNKIAHDQYERYALRYLKPGNPYLIRLRPSDFDYSTLNGADDLSVTKGGSNNFDKYKTNKFVFNGSPYGITQDEAKKEYKEQLFADDALLEYEFKGFVPNSNKTLNWVIGNSYTCPISLDKLGQGMQNAEGITFSNTVYIYSFGSQGYVPVKIYDAQQSILLTLPDVGIPAMGVFMVRVSKKSTPSFPGKPFRIDKGMLMHSTTDNSLVDFTGNNGKKPAPSKLENQVRLTMTPENNDFVYDKIAVGLRTDASLGNDNYDAEKIFNNVDDGFQLYTVSSSLTKLSINGLPSDASNVNVYLKPSDVASSYVLRATDLETLTTEGAWLEDLITKDVVDLYMTNEYRFNTTPNDPERRFILHFKKPSDTGNGNGGINSYYYDGYVFIKDLTIDDLNSFVFIYDVQGRLIRDRVLIDSYPILKIPVDLIKGIYVTQIKGTRSLVSKFVKQ